MVEGKNEDISTIELCGGARIHYIFQSIYVKSLEVRDFVACSITTFSLCCTTSLFYNEVIELFTQDVDPCEDVTDEDIRMAIQNATGPRSALFVPEVYHPTLGRTIVRVIHG
jgi:dynamin 1-like protein